ASGSATPGSAAPGAAPPGPGMPTARRSPSEDEITAPSSMQCSAERGAQGQESLRWLPRFSSSPASGSESTLTSLGSTSEERSSPFRAEATSPASAEPTVSETVEESDSFPAEAG